MSRRLFHIRPATAEDVPQLIELQQLSYPPNFIEEAAVFEAIVGYGMSLVVEQLELNDLKPSVDQEIVKAIPVGYALVHTIEDPEQPPKLNSAASKISTSGAKHVFLHDVAVQPEYRRFGLASDLVKSILKDAKSTNAASVSLVCLHGAKFFWEKYGFETSGLNTEAIATYGEGACHMALPLQSKL